MKGRQEMRRKRRKKRKKEEGLGMQSKVWGGRGIGGDLLARKKGDAFARWREKEKKLGKKCVPRKKNIKNFTVPKVFPSTPALYSKFR